VYDDLMRILRTPDVNGVGFEFANKVICGLITENKPCFDASLIQFLLKVTGEFILLVYAVWF
jgi:histidyl-tRNA synthetase